MPNLRFSVKALASKLLVLAVIAQNFTFVVSSADAATQNAYRWRNDDGSESTATYDGAENTPLTGVTVGTTERLRFGQANSGSESELSEIASVTLDPGEEGLWTGVIDKANGFAYFGTYTSPGQVIKVALGDGSAPPTRVGAITLNTGEWYLKSSVIDTVNGYAYFGTDDTTARVIKVDISPGNFARVGAVTLNTNESFLYSAVIDVANGYAYFGGYGFGNGRVYKIALGSGASPPTRVGALTFNAGELGAMSAVIDTANGYAYFASDTSPAKIVKVDISTSLPTRVSAITLNSGENYPYAAVLDDTTGYAYFGTYTFPAKVVKVDTAPGNFARVGAATFNSGEGGIFGAGVIDVVNGFAYFGTDEDDPGSVVKVALGAGASPPSRVDAIVMGAGETAIYSGVIDEEHGYAYFGSFYESPGIVAKVSIAPKASFRLEYGKKTSTCAAIGTWTQVPATATSEHFQMSPSANVTDGAATTDSGITNGNVNFVPGEIHDTTSQTGEISYGETQFTEVEYSIEATVNATSGGDYCFRLTDAGSPSAFTYANYAEASMSGGGGPTPNTTDNVVVLSRIAVNSSANATIHFVLNNTLSSQLTMTFDPAFTGMNVSGASAITPSAPGCMSNFVATGPNSFTADKSSCTGDVTITGVAVTNPGTPGGYLVSWTNDDDGYAMVAIVDSDQITVNAQVDPSITFDLNANTDNSADAAPYSVALGALTLGAVNHSDNTGVNSIWANLDTNATGGAVVTVLSQNSALKSLSVPSDAIPNSASSMSAGTANYGLCVNSVSVPTAASGTFQASSPYDSGTCDPAGSTNAVKALSSVTPTSILDSNAAPVTTGVAEILVNAAMSASTVAHSDYADVLTFVATGTF